MKTKENKKRKTGVSYFVHSILSVSFALMMLFSPFNTAARAVSFGPADTREILERLNNSALVSAIPDNGVLLGEDTGNKDTFTGYEPLPTVSYSAKDSNNTAGISTKVIEHSYGVAKDEKPHSISAESQSYFEKSGYNAVTYDRKSAEEGKKYLYLTFDCGYENGNTSLILDTLKEKNVPAAFFCTLYQVQSEPELTAKMIKEGHIIGNHSCSHPNFSKISAEKMASELEGFDNFMRTKFGYCSSFFRYPEGAYNEYSLSEVCDKGFKICFWSLAYSDWDENNQKGADYAYETVMSRIHPGSIMLLHSVSSDNAAALGRIIDSARDMGYEFKSLEDLP